MGARANPARGALAGNAMAGRSFASFRPSAPRSTARAASAEASPVEREVGPARQLLAGREVELHREPSARRIHLCAQPEASALDAVEEDAVHGDILRVPASIERLAVG